jgi:hypothetical protein
MSPPLSPPLSPPHLASPIASPIASAGRAITVVTAGPRIGVGTALPSCVGEQDLERLVMTIISNLAVVLGFDRSKSRT